MEFENEFICEANICRVCLQDGEYELTENTFRLNDTDVLLVTAFRCFSEVIDVSDPLPFLFERFVKSFFSGSDKRRDVFV